MNEIQNKDNSNITPPKALGEELQHPFSSHFTSKNDLDLRIRSETCCTLLRGFFKDCTSYKALATVRTAVLL
jgi:hypothetical protein